MYCKAFGLRCLPFEDSADARFFCATPLHEEFLAVAVGQPVKEHLVTVVLGDAGIGKTVLVRELAARLHPTHDVVVVPAPSADGFNLVRETCKSFGVPLPSEEDRAECLEQLRQHLIACAKKDRHSVLIVDQAENLSLDTLRELMRMSDLHNERGRMLAVVLAGRPHLSSSLECPELSDLSRKAKARYTLEPFSLAETEAYISHRLQTAGTERTGIFAKRAVRLVFEASGGVPRAINRLGHAALLAAHQGESKQVTWAIAKSVVRFTETSPQSIRANEVGLQSADELTPEMAGTVPASSATRNPVAMGSNPHLDSGNSCDQREEAVAGQRSSGAQSDHRTEGSYRDELSRMPAALEALLSRGEELLGQVEKGRGESEDNERTADRGSGEYDAAESRFVALIERAERACERADSIELRLNSYAELLADNVGSVQHGMAQLMAGFEAREKTEEQLGLVLEQVQTTGVDVEKRVALQRVSVDEAMATLERSRQESIDMVLDHCRARTEERFEAHLRTLDETVRVVQGKLQAAHENTSAKLSEWEAKADQFSRGMDEQTRKVEQDRAQEAIAAEKKLHDMSDRMAAAAEDVESRIGTAKRQLDAQAQNAAEAVKTCEEQVQNMLSCATKASADVESRIDTAKRQLDVQTQSAAEAVKTCEAQVQDMLSRATKASADVEQQIDVQHADLRETMKEAQEFHNRLVKVALPFCQEKLEEKFKLLAGQCDEQTTTARAELQELAERATSTTEERFKLLAGQCDKQTTTARAELQELIEQATSATRDLDAGLKTARDKFKQSVSDTNELHQRIGNMALAKYRKRLQEEFDQTLKEQRTKREEEVAQLRKEIAEIRQAGERIEGELIKPASETIDLLTSRIDEIEKHGATISSTLDAGHAKLEGDEGRAEVLRETVKHLGLAVDEQLDRADRGQRGLGEVVRRGEQLLLEVQAVNGQAEAMQHNVANTLVEVGAAQEKASQLREGLGQSEQVIARLTAARETGKETDTQLHKTAEMVNRLQETLHRLTVDAEGKVGQLDSHASAANHILRQLSDATKSGHGLVEQAGEATSRAELAATTGKEQSERLIQELSILAKTTEGTAKELANCHAQALNVMERFDEATARAGGLSEQLTDQVASAEQKAQVIETRCGQAGKLAERLQGVTRVLDNAKALEGQIRETADDARAMHEELTLVADNAMLQCSRLGDVNTEADELITKQQDLSESGAIMLAQVEVQIASARNTAHAGERLLREFGEQADSLRVELSTLAQQAAQLERGLGRPAEIVANAQAQALQLEQVCEAVRKVFAGLSKASLEARKQTTDHQMTSKLTGERLNRLTTETNKATDVLREWLEEATRVQARLERTLDQCPPISQTHPTAGLQAASESLELSSRVANPSAVAEPKTTTEQQRKRPLPPAGATKPVGVPRHEVIPPPTSRADEVSRMIEDAKRAVPAATP